MAIAGREVRESMFNKVADLFHDLDMGMLPISVIFPYLPIPAHWNRDRSASHDITPIQCALRQAFPTLTCVCATRAHLLLWGLWDDGNRTNVFCLEGR